MMAYQAAIPNDGSTGKVWDDLEQMNDGEYHLYYKMHTILW